MLETVARLSTVATIVLPIILVYRYQFAKVTRLRAWQVFLLGVVLIWLLIQIGVYCTNAHLRAALDAFDIDNNGFFTADEINEAQQAAMRRVVSDTGRSLAPITGAVFAVGYMSMLLILFKIIGWFTQWVYAKCFKSDQA